MSLRERVAMVTGGARGIGREIALALAAEGASVAITDLDQEGVEATARDLEARGGRALGLCSNVADPEQVASSVARIRQELGSLDILVCNAGITRDTVLMRMKDSDWDPVLEVNLGGVEHGLAAVSEGMVQRGFGRVISITSVVGQMGNAGQVNYATSKAGIIGLTREWARRLGGTGVTVNAVAPGFIDTDMTRDLPQKVKDELLRQIPLGRLGQPAEVAQAVVYLCNAGYVTGQVLNVDGGLVMH